MTAIPHRGEPQGARSSRSSSTTEQAGRPVSLSHIKPCPHKENKDKKEHASTLLPCHLLLRSLHLWPCTLDVHLWFLMTFMYVRTSLPLAHRLHFLSHQGLPQALPPLRSLPRFHLDLIFLSAPSAVVNSTVV